MIYTHVLNKPGLGIRSPLDDEPPPVRRFPNPEIGAKSFAFKDERSSNAR